MKERPILFSAPMVRAILAGRKTQTRRIIKSQPSDYQVETVAPQRREGQPPKHPRPYFDAYNGGPHWCWWDEYDRQGADWIKCPYGVPGDRLWVKETWRPFKAFQPWDLDIRYHADGEERTIKDGEFGERDWTMPKHAARGNVSPLFMPRFASRLTLEITGVRVERLAAISEADAEAEGIREPSLGDLHVIDHGQPGSVARGDAPPLVLWEFLWKHVNGDASWDANPWVWVLEFKRIEAAHG